MFNMYPYQNLQDLNLDYILKTLKSYVDTVQNLVEWKTEHEKEYKELLNMYNSIVSGNFPPDMISALNNWLIMNSADIFGELAKMVFFGITEDGYFVAYIPESWSDIMFGTSDYDVIIPGIDYGHLILSY